MSHSSSPPDWKRLDDHLRRTLSSARAAKGYSWENVSQALAARGWNITPANLMTRHSRGAFRANEWLLIMDVLEVRSIEVPSIR
jgi:hypothetical protein